MEHIGSIHALLFAPEWFTEGMAYALSEAPHRPLPGPMEGWRSKVTWYLAVKKEALWDAARRL
ncbi:hypothetical protein N5C43_08945 [Comamonas terrigena]|uniref:hypothetical protein n=1 Tax=Comamonas terrigena TaxID=32013 RepID=UPI002448EA89|nr:hypothetical protein [Comamonas terrigena]MDH1291384.1 hypothetical protein [Comamonas terrigena]